MSSSPDQWRHVSTAVNPADYLTRGVKVEELVNLKWEGPEYLKQDESTWPRNVTDKEPSDALKEVKKRYMSRSDLDNTCTMLSRCERVKLKNGNDKDRTVWQLEPERFF